MCKVPPGRGSFISEILWLDKWDYNNNNDFNENFEDKILVELRTSCKKTYRSFFF